MLITKFSINDNTHGFRIVNSFTRVKGKFFKAFPGFNEIPV